MSWHTKENYDLSEYHPRKQLPNGHGQHTIARVQPMVPEVSVFSQTSNSGGSRRPLRTVNNFEKSVEDSLGRTIPSKKAPMPHQPPIRGEFRTSSDISKIYPDKEPSVTLKSSKSVGSVGNTTLEMLKNPEDLLKLVNWHSQEIHQQNQQINQLLQEKKSTQEQFQRLQEQVDRLQEQVQETSLQKSALPNLPKISKPLMVDSATQMSNPSSPNPKRSTMHTFEEPHSILRSESANVSHTMGASFNHENSSLPLGASAGKYVSPRPPMMPRPFSQILFEEPAEQDHCAAEESGEEDEEEVQCVDLEPVANIDELFDNENATKEFKSQTEVDCAEVLRLRDMGISFVNKEDLYPQLRKDKKAAEIEQPSFFHPKAASDPFQNSPSTSSSTTEYSLMINNAAIQYLNETQLTYIAKNSPQTPQHNASLEQANFTRYGMPDNNISVATKEFMSRNRLTKTPSERL